MVNRAKDGTRFKHRLTGERMGNNLLMAESHVLSTRRLGTDALGDVVQCDPNHANISALC